MLSAILLAFIAIYFFAENKKSDAEINQISPVVSVKKNKIEKTKQQNETKEKATDKKFEIIFLGDLMFDRYIREISTQKGNDYVLAGLKDYLKEANLVVANLEGPITNEQSKSLGTKIGQAGHLIFTFTPNWAGTLNDFNIKLVSLDNNHIFNFGASGVASTKHYLDESKLDYFGLEEQPASKPFAVGEKNLFFVSFNQFRKTSYSQTLSEIKRIKSQTPDNLVVVYCHWGDEYQLTANKNQQQLAHEFIDTGADLVVGTHPHVVQNSEIYSGKKIYYSLGNAVFDQYFSTETEEGMGLKVIINDGQQPWQFQEQKIILRNNGQTVIQ